MEFVRSDVEVKVYGEAYKLRLPTYKETVKYRTDLKECGDDEEKQSDLLFKFLATLGLPEKASEMLEIHHLGQLVDFILKKTK